MLGTGFRTGAHTPVTARGAHQPLDRAPCQAACESGQPTRAPGAPPGRAAPALARAPPRCIAMAAWAAQPPTGGSYGAPAGFGFGYAPTPQDDEARLAAEV